jgi:hypothetical protein
MPSCGSLMSSMYCCRQAHRSPCGRRYLPAHHESVSLMKPISAFALICVLLLTAWCVTCPSWADQSVTLLQGACTITVPDGWQSTDTVGDEGAVLQPPDPRTWPVEVMLWPIPEGGAQTAGAAAAAHEAVIRRVYPYTRRDSSAFTADGGKRGMQVVGEVETASGRAVTCLFIAFADASHYCVIGTFSLPDRADATMADYLQPVAHSLRLGDEGREAPPIARPTVTDPPPAVVSPSHQPPVQPRYDPTAVVSPADPHSAPMQVLGDDSLQLGDAGRETPPTALPTVTEPPPAVVSSSHQSPVQPHHDPTAVVSTPDPHSVPLQLLGDDFLRLHAPAGWQLERSDGRWIVRPSGVQSHAMGVLIWPLVCDESDTTAADVARAALDQWQPSRGQSFQFRSGGEDATVSFTGTITAPAGSLQLVGACTTDHQSALLTAMYLPTDHAEADRVKMLQMLIGTRIEPLQFTRPRPEGEYYRWRPPGLPEFSVPIPQGWMARGQVERKHDRWAVSIEATDFSPGRRYISWKQPLSPLFRQLSDLLVSMGYRSADHYSPQPGQPYYTLLARPQSPEQFIQEYWNRHTQLSLTDAVIVRSDSPPELADLLPTDDAQSVYAIVEGASVLGPRHNHYLISIGSTPEEGLHVWQAVVLEAAGLAEDRLSSVQALEQMVAGAAFDDGYTPDPALEEMVRAARQAVGALPVHSGRSSGLVSVYSPLSLLNADGAERWQPPADAFARWQDALQTGHLGSTPRDIPFVLDTQQ